MSGPVDVLAVLDAAEMTARAIGAEDAADDFEAVRAAFAGLIETASLVLAQAKEGKPLDLIALGDAIDLAGGETARRAKRAAVKGGAA